MTHDILKNIMDKPDIKVNKIEISDLRDTTCFALIHLTSGGKALSIDSRPSDAIAIALRPQPPIVVSDEVLRKSKQIEATVKRCLQVKARKERSGKTYLKNLSQIILENTRRRDQPYQQLHAP